MPNWIHVQVSLSGPRDEVERFRTTCIRRMDSDDDSKIGFDFQSLIPMPDDVRRSIEGGPDESAKLSPEEAHRMPLWWNWCISNWGVKWNASNYAEIRSASDDLAFAFEVPWSFPHPIFAALAEQFPLLTGGVSAMGWEDSWVTLGSLSNGCFSAVTSDMTRETVFLAEAMPNEVIRAATARVLSEAMDCEVSTAREPTKRLLEELSDQSFWKRIATDLEPHLVLSLKGAFVECGLDWTTSNRPEGNHLWHRVCTHLRSDTVRRLNFAFDVERFCDWHDEDGSWFDDESLPLHDIVGSLKTLRNFIERNGRSYHKIDRRLLALLAQDLKASFASNKTEAVLDQGFRLEVAHMLVNVSENDLWEWAAHAIFRPADLNLADLSTMQASFVEYASRLRCDALDFLAVENPESQIAA